nr:YetF domain-containing protein [Martelella lutilitoris]
MFLDGTPTVLISDGRPDLRALKRSRVSLEDVLATARQLHGLERLDQIKSAVLEADGGVSIIPR